MFDDMFEEEFDGDDNFTVPIETQGLKEPRASMVMLGNDATEKKLLELYHNQTLPHSLIFAGPKGVGKATMAFRLSRFLLKDGAGADDGMDSLFGDVPPKPTSFHVGADDPVFHKVASGGHPDLRYYDIPISETTGKKKSGVDVASVRKIPPFLKTTTSQGGWKIVIVDDAETMTYEAQNAILKILEEPPAKSLLILVCNRLGSMLPTIRSRCRTFHFSPLSYDDLNVLLKQAAPQTTIADIQILNALSGGSMGRAQSLLEENGINMLRTLMAFFEQWPKFEWSKIHLVADNLSRPDSLKSYVGFTEIFEWICQSFLRAKACKSSSLPEILQIEGLEKLLNHYSLEQWIEICEKLNAHFIAIDKSSLDKRQGVIGAFALLGA